MKKLQVEGWKVEKLADVLQKTETVNPTLKPNHDFLYVDVSSVDNQTYLIEEVTQLKGKDAPSRARKLIKTGDVIFATVRPTLKRIAIVPEEYDNQVCSTGYFVLRPRDFISNKYLFYFLLSDEFMEKMEKLQKGASYPAVTDNEVKSQMIAYPPLPEQQRIVSLLDETFAGLAQVHANAERNLVNAREVFSSSLNEYFGHARNGWKAMKLDDACIVERGSSPRPIKQYQTTSKDGVNWIKIGDTKGVEKYIYSTREKITKEGAKQSRFVKEGDFILTNSMSFGNPYIMKTEGYIHDGWFVLRLKEFIDTEFFWYLLVSPFVQNQFNQLASGAIVKNISGDLVKKANLFIPPLEEQRAIVERLDALAAETSRLEAVYQSKLEAVEELKKSVLGKAFEGEL
jgi:type I restriction enzyme S subunit